MELLDTKANPLKIYRQAKRILKSTSRARNADWYKTAEELPLQWHLWIGAHRVVSAIYNSAQNQWFEGPQIPDVSFDIDENGNHTGLDDGSRNLVHELLRQILSTKEFGKKPKSLGISIHLANDFRVRDLAPDFSADTDFNALNELLVSAPDIALGDDTILKSDGNWRLLPLLGVKDSDKRSVAVQVTNQLELVAKEFREYGEMRNMPIIVNAKAAPLEALSALPYLAPQFGTFENTICLLQYESYTVIAATGKRGELLLIRPLFHRSGVSLSESEVSDVITKTGALLDMKSPRILYLALAGAGGEELKKTLSLYLEGNSDAVFQCASVSNIPITQGVPGGLLELAMATNPELPEESSSATILEYRNEWGLQDFFGPSGEEILRMPTRGDLQLLKFSGYAQKAAILCLLGFAGWTGMDFFTKMRSEAWKLEPAAAEEMEANLVKLQKERIEWSHWNNLLEKRSEGWLAMEALLELFPDNGGVILRSANYRAESTTANERSNEDKLGVTRTWELSGYSNPEVATQISSLGSRTHIASLLNEIAEKNKADYLAVGEESRSLDVTLQQKQASMPSSFDFPAKVARHFRNSFELKIDQSIDATDELAFNISK
ncbi:MAG: hypothetical protein CMO55_21645 [Verrucomicrobiales bacterium]|nr:hypothetical protein [Verrucomicrobiales bacterium]